LETYAPIRLIMASSPQLPDNIETRKEINLEITQSCLDNGGHYIPRLIRVNLVSAAPSCYAFDLGCKLGHLDNRLPEIVVYHYVSTATPKYPYGIIVTGKNKGSLVIKN